MIETSGIKYKPIEIFNRTRFTNISCLLKKLALRYVIIRLKKMKNREDFLSVRIFNKQVDDFDCKSRDFLINKTVLCYKKKNIDIKTFNIEI